MLRTNRLYMIFFKDSFQKKICINILFILNSSIQLYQECLIHEIDRCALHPINPVIQPLLQQINTQLNENDCGKYEKLFIYLFVFIIY